MSGEKWGRRREKQKENKNWRGVGRSDFDDYHWLPASACWTCHIAVYASRLIFYFVSGTFKTILQLECGCSSSYNLLSRN